MTVRTSYDAVARAGTAPRRAHTAVDGVAGVLERGILRWFDGRYERSDSSATCASSSSATTSVATPLSRSCTGRAAEPVAT